MAKFGILLVIMIWFVIVAVFIVCSGTFTLGSITVPGYDLTVTYQKVRVPHLASVSPPYCCCRTRATHLFC